MSARIPRTRTRRHLTDGQQMFVAVAAFLVGGTLVTAMTGAGYLVSVAFGVVTP